VKNRDGNVIAFQASRSLSLKNHFGVPAPVVCELKPIPSAEFNPVIQKADQGEVCVGSQSKLGRRHPGRVAHQQQPVEAARCFALGCDGLQFHEIKSALFSLGLNMHGLIKEKEADLISLFTYSVLAAACI
jgi:hypothetical protein